MIEKKRQHGIPYNSLAQGIMHGPYPAAPKELIDHYQTNRQVIFSEDHRSEEQFLADVESEWQYDQHCAAVDEASAAGRISPEHALFMMEKALRPWFIGRRNPDETR